MAFNLINIGLFIFGMGCWLFAVRPKTSLAMSLMVFWTVLELSNGVIHIGYSISLGAYMPGLFTAFLLMLVAIKLGSMLLKKEPSGSL